MVRFWCYTILFPFIAVLLYVPKLIQDSYALVRLAENFKCYELFEDYIVNLGPV